MVTASSPSECVRGTSAREPRSGYVPSHRVSAAFALAELAGELELGLTRAAVMNEAAELPRYTSDSAGGR